MRRFLRISAADFRALWADDRLSLIDIAQRLDVAVPTVQRRAKALGLSRRRMGQKPKIDMALLRRLWIAGVSTGEAGEALGLHRDTFIKAAQRAGLPPRGRGWIPAMTLAEFHEIALRQRMAGEARATQAALKLSEMVDGKQGRRDQMRKVA
ncbi:hypothetical protein ACN9JG_06210 [Cereibacter azotoformans]|uniref:hypothetical protein n=1 Tax=Cereibacter azotoformans TaxID=43057 RepID=UPI003B220C7D